MRRRRLLFRATHRGTYENDLMLGGFLRAHMRTRWTTPRADCIGRIAGIARPGPCRLACAAASRSRPSRMTRCCAASGRCCSAFGRQSRDDRSPENCHPNFCYLEGCHAPGCGPQAATAKAAAPGLLPKFTARQRAGMPSCSPVAAPRLLGPSSTFHAMTPAWPGWPRRAARHAGSRDRALSCLQGCLPYDRVSPNPVLVAERVAALTRLLEIPKTPRIVLTTVNALVQRIRPCRRLRGRQPAAHGRRCHHPAGEAVRLPGSTAGYMAAPAR